MLLPDIESSIAWIEGLENNSAPGKIGASGSQDADKTIQSLRSMVTLLNKIHDFAELEAGICSDMPEPLEINKIIHHASKHFDVVNDIGSLQIILNPSPEPIPLLCHGSKLIQCFANIFRFAAINHRADTKISVSIKKISDLEMAVVIRYSGNELSKPEIKRLLTTKNMVEHIIALGANNIKLIMPIACSLIELHSGGISIKNQPHNGIEIQVTLPIYNKTTELLLTQ